jgi:hypothetical protein
VSLQRELLRIAIRKNNETTRCALSIANSQLATRTHARTHALRSLQLVQLLLLLARYVFLLGPVTFGVPLLFFFS